MAKKKMAQSPTKEKEDEYADEGFDEIESPPVNKNQILKGILQTCFGVTPKSFEDVQGGESVNLGLGTDSPVAEIAFRPAYPEKNSPKKKKASISESLDEPKTQNNISNIILNSMSTKPLNNQKVVSILGGTESKEEKANRLDAVIANILGESSTKNCKVKKTHKVGVLPSLSSLSSENINSSHKQSSVCQL